MKKWCVSKEFTKILVALSVISTLAFANSNDAWTEASTTNAAKNGAFEKWSLEWDEIKDDYTQISIAPGRTSSELNFAWYSVEGDKDARIKIGKKSDLTDAKELNVVSEYAIKGYLSNKAVAKGLTKNTKYYYSYTKNGVWTEAEMLKTQDDKSFDFILVGDPQIGSSSSNIATGSTKKMGQELAVLNDAFNWDNTLDMAVELSPNVSFVLSAGDQIQSRDKKKKDPLYAGNEIEYAGFLSADLLKNIPLATSIGNHDSLGKNYSFHFNIPNSSEFGKTNAGGDYYFNYGSAIFMMLNTNNLNISEHKTFIEKTLKENPDSKWRVVTIHHDIYGSGEHSNEPQIVNLRYNLIPIFEENGIDVVFTGHDHTYSRSFLMKGGQIKPSKMISDDDFDEYFEGEKSVDDKYNDYLRSVYDIESIEEKAGNTVVNPKGILYITTGSASGSKYYELTDNQQSYVAKRWQKNVPTFSVVHVDDDSFSINTYRTDTLKKIDSDFSIIKMAERE